VAILIENWSHRGVDFILGRFCLVGGDNVSLSRCCRLGHNHWGLLHIINLSSSRALRVSIIRNNSAIVFSVDNLRALFCATNLNHISLFTIYGDLRFVARLLLNDDLCSTLVMVLADIHNDLGILAILIIDDDCFGVGCTTINNINLGDVNRHAWLILAFFNWLNSDKGRWLKRLGSLRLVISGSVDIAVFIKGRLPWVSDITLLRHFCRHELRCFVLDLHNFGVVLIWGIDNVDYIVAILVGANYDCGDTILIFDVLDFAFNVIEFNNDLLGGVLRHHNINFVVALLRGVNVVICRGTLIVDDVDDWCFGVRLDFVYVGLFERLLRLLLWGSGSLRLLIGFLLRGSGSSLLTACAKAPSSLQICGCFSLDLVYFVLKACHVIINGFLGKLILSSDWIAKLVHFCVEFALRGSKVSLYACLEWVDLNLDVCKRFTLFVIEQLLLLKCDCILALCVNLTNLWG